MLKPNPSIVETPIPINVDLPGVNAQERTKDKLIESLKIGAEDMLNTPLNTKDEEELVHIEV
jgi:hypothetical protein